GLYGFVWGGVRIWAIFGGVTAPHKSLNASLTGIMAALAVVLAVFALTAENKIATIVSLLLMGTIGLSAAPGLMVRIMRYAADAPTMASGANVAAFNVGNAVGAWIGGLTIAAGYGFVSPLWVGAGLGVAALAVAAGGSLGGRTAAPADIAAGAAPQADKVGVGVQ
ncbi:MFS transporter, partial [Streptomyces sp. NPDC006324]